MGPAESGPEPVVNPASSTPLRTEVKVKFISIDTPAEDAVLPHAAQGVQIVGHAGKKTERKAQNRAENGIAGTFGSSQSRLHWLHSVQCPNANAQSSQCSRAS